MLAEFVVDAIHSFSEGGLFLPIFLLKEGHGRFHPIRPGLVGRGRNDRSLSASGNGNGFTHEGRVITLFYRGKEGIHVDTGDYSCHA